MVKMAETKEAVKPALEIEGEVIGHAAEEPEGPLEEVSLVEVKKSRGRLLKNIGKLKPLLPILSGGLRLVDHGAAQMLVQLINFANGANATQSAAQEELHHGLDEIQSSHRELHLQVQDQTVEMRRLEDQVTLLRQTVENNATEHAVLVKNVKSLNNLIRVLGAGLVILLIILITLTAALLTRHH